MSYTSRLCRRVGLFVFLFLSIMGDVSGLITSSPLNAVAAVGQQAIFNCTSGSTLPSWVLTTKREELGTGPVVDIAINCVVQPGFATHYEVDRPGGSSNICNLIVKDVTMQQAGLYTCSDTSSGLSAILTVIDSSVNVTYNNTPNVMEGESVIITCSLNYSGPVEPAATLRPHFYWTDYTGRNVSSFYDSTPVNGPVISQIMRTAGRQDITPFTCHVYLQLISSATPGYVTNVPSVNSSVSSPPIAVLYPIGKISINTTVPTEDKCVSKQENLTCTADANPPAQFFWLDVNNNTRTSGADISISSGGEYQCFGSNSIRNQIYNETKTVTETSCYAVYNLTMSGSNCTNNSCVCDGSQSSFILTCTAFGNPEPMIEWLTDVDYQDFVNGTIVATVNGQYGCVASNEYGGTKYNKTSAEPFVLTYCEDPLPTTLPPLTAETTLEPGAHSADSQINVGAIIGIIIGVIVIANIVATSLFFWYYKKVGVSHSGKKERNNKLRLDRRFTWLKKMMPCVSDTKESAGSNCLWVSLFILLGIVTGIVTFPIWILLANKYEKNNETSALTRRESGDGNGSGENGRRPANSSANHNQPPSTNQMNAMRREDPYQNGSREHIELNNSLGSGNLRVSDSQPSRPPPAGRPPPPPNKPTMNLSTNRSKDYTVNDQQTQAANPEHTTYADLPFVQRDTLPTATPVQFLNVSNDDTYASLNKT